MKDLVINGTMNSIKKYKDFDDIKLLEIKYGLESLYLTLTKILVICLINLLIGTIKELLYIFLFYGLLRISGFGAHAKKTSHCWIYSLLIFLLIPTLVKYLVIPIPLTLSFLVIMLIIITIYAPADTEKRPLIKKKKRIMYKVICSVNTLVYIISAIFINKNYFYNIILFSVLVQVIMILPITYKILGLKYNNYKTYVRKEDKNEIIS